MRGTPGTAALQRRQSLAILLERNAELGSEAVDVVRGSFSRGEKRLAGSSIGSTIDIVKEGVRVHHLALDDAVGPMEQAWITDFFAREDRVTLTTMERLMEGGAGADTSHQNGLQARPALRRP